MIKLTPRSARKASSPLILVDRIRYISDSNEPDHRGKTILPAKSYNCPTQSPEDFSKEVLRLEALYQNRREGKRGKRSPRLFEEVIYSTPPGVFPTEQERERIEGMIIGLVGTQTACRFAWHIDEDGRADLHILMGAKDLQGQVTLWADFGGKSRPNLNAEFDRLDEDIAAYLSERQPVQSAMQVRQSKSNMAPFAVELAEKHPDPITAETLMQTVGLLGYNISRITKKTISIVFRGKKRPHRYNIEDLLLHIEMAQERIRQRIKPPPKKELPSPPAETPATPATPATPDNSENFGDNP